METMNTDTPETDGEWNRLACQDHPEFERNLADFARKLERERDEADDQLDQIILRLGETQECLIDAERQRDRLAEALRLCLDEMKYSSKIGQPIDETRREFAIADEALQSLTNPSEL